MPTPLTKRSTKDRELNGKLLSDRAYQAIRDMLVTLRIAPGTALDEERLAGQLGVGRTPVREAIKRLAYQKLVTVYPRRGTFASEIEVADLEAICDVRERLEGLAAELAARHARYQEREELRAMLERLEGASGQQDLLALDTALHRLIYRLAHNDYLLDMCGDSLDVSMRIWHLALERLPHLKDHVGNQRTVVEAILERQPARARELAEHHVRAFEDDVRGMF